MQPGVTAIPAARKFDIACGERSSAKEPCGVTTGIDVVGESKGAAARGS